MKDRKQIAEDIGESIFSAIEKIEKEKYKGKHLIVPITYRHAKDNEWSPPMTKVTIDMPIFTRRILKFDKKGLPYSDFEMITMAEFYGW
ncbi:MAG TPA: hypothetical protein PKW79_00335 [Rhabdochlamydiaceae bacterium]|nr:hypothetical protein [Rhabdochlamydiaceae bacterium]